VPRGTGGEEGGPWRKKEEMGRGWPEGRGGKGGGDGKGREEMDEEEGH